MAKKRKNGKRTRIQMIPTEKEIIIGVRSTRRTHNTEFPVVIGKPFTYKKKKLKTIIHHNN